MRTLRRLWALIEEENRPRFIVLALALTLGSALEAVGIGMVLPYLNAVTSPDDLLENERLEPILGTLGITEPRELLVASSVLIVAIFIGKNLYIGALWKRVYNFLYQQYASLSTRMLEGYLAAPYPYHLDRNTADLIRNTTDASSRVFRQALGAALEIFAELLVIAGLVAVLMVVHTAAAAGVLAVLSVGGWALASGYRSRLRQLGQVQNREYSRLVKAVQESLGSLKETKIFGRERDFLSSFSDSAQAMAEARRDDQVIRRYPRLFLETGAVVGMVGMAALLVFTGTSLIDVIPVLGVFGVASVRLMPSVSRVVGHINTLRVEKAATDIAYGEMSQIKDWTLPEESDDIERGVLPFKENIEFDEVSYRYPDAPDSALGGINFRIGRGDHVGVIGPSGAGKSTLVDLLLGLLTPSGGGIHVDSTDIQTNLTGWQARLGYIPQDTFLTDDSLLRNVAFTVDDESIDKRRVWKALDAAQLAEFVKALDEGVETVIGERGVRLSGGQRQRIAIARALYHDPDVLVLDEATSSLDYETERRVSEAVDALSGEKTIITVTHRLNSVRKCDKIHVLKDGQLEASGRYSELSERSATFRQLAKSQIQE